MGGLFFEVFLDGDFLGEELVGGGELMDPGGIEIVAVF